MVRWAEANAGLAGLRVRSRGLEDIYLSLTQTQYLSSTQTQTRKEASG